VPIFKKQTTLFDLSSSEIWVTDLAISLCNWIDR